MTRSRSRVIAVGVVSALALVVGPATSARTSGDPTLTVTVTGPGTVVDDAKQISCPGSCQGKYDDKATVTLTASPDSGATFDEWGKACSGSGKCVVDMSKGDQTVTATFSAGKPATSTLTVAVSGPGRVTDDSGKISCPGTCQAVYDAKVGVVGLTATPDQGATFESWGGACAGTPKCAVDMSKGDQTVSAVFTAAPPTTTTTTTAPPEDVCRALRTIDSQRQKIRNRKLPAATAARLDAAVVAAERPLIPAALAKDCVIVAKRAIARSFRPTHLSKVKPRPRRDHEQGGTDEIGPLAPAPGGRKSLPRGQQAKLVPFKGGKAGQRGLARTDDTTSPVRVFLRSNMGEPPGIVGYPLEPQVASGGGVIFYSGNSQAAYSLDNGRTFTFLPSVDTLFGVPEGGYAGDSVLRYAPQIDRFLWLMQYDCTGGDCSRPPYNRYRLGVASPGAISGQRSNPERAWRIYNLPTSLFGEASWFDFPIMSVGSTQLFLTWNSVSTRAVNARINLRQLGLGAPSVAVYHFTHRRETFWRTAEHAGTTGYWIRNSDDDGHAVIYHLDDASGLVFWDTVRHDRIPQFDFASNSPLGTPWNGRGTPSGAQVASATVRSGTLWVAWTAGRRFTAGGAMEWAQPHVYIAQYELPSLSFSGSLNVWQRDYAIVGPGLTTNPEGDVAMMASIGGPSMSPRPAAGLLTGRDAQTLFELWTSDPTAGGGQGDYSEVEPEYPGGTRFVTAGYVSNLRGGVVKNEYVFMRFGRSAADLRPPRVTIDWPREGSSYELGQTIPLRASAWDEEDGTLTGDSLIWRLGTIILGRGTSPEYRPFSPGDQTITLSATDSGRRTGTATVHIHVSARTGRPTVFIVSPASGTNFPRGAAAFADFSARATDPSGARPTLRWTDEYTDERRRAMRLDFGVGPSASARLYSSGSSPTSHRITVTATNARGQTATDTITVTSGVYS